MEQVEERVIQRAKLEGFMDASEEHPHSMVALIPFMKHYGYSDGTGWWIPIEDSPSER